MALRRLALSAVLNLVVSLSLQAQGVLSPSRFINTNKNDTVSAADTVQSTVVTPDVSRESPRASLRRFFMLVGDGHFDSAAIYLDIPDSMAKRGPILTKQLKAILDRHLWIELDSVSSEALGDTTDGLPAGVDELGLITSSQGLATPVRLVRFNKNDDKLWRFSRRTVVSIPDWYSTLRDRWILEHLPTSLLKNAPLNMLRWQWLALPFVLLVATILGLVASKILRRFIRKILARYDNPHVSTAIMRLGSPFTLTCALIAITLIIPSLGLYQPAEKRFHTIINAGFFIAFVWGIWRVIDVFKQILDGSEWGNKNPSSRALLPLGARTAKVFIFVIAFITVFSMLGYPVASLIAGLGIGGLALALAAQKTVENLFGAFSLGVDQPFREGDFVKVEDFLGTVETIGLRSTRFRTLDRTLISIPNGHVAEMRLESYTARDRLRFHTIVRLMYGTTISQVREILPKFEAAITNHPQHWPEGTIVNLSELGEHSLNISVRAWFLTTDYLEFMRIRQGILFQFMEIVEQAGAKLAVPSRALVYSNEQGLERDSELDDLSGNPNKQDRNQDRDIV